MLVQSELKEVLKSNLIAIYGMGFGPDDSGTLDRFCDAIAKSVVDYVHSNADIEIVEGDLIVDPDSFANGAGQVTGTGKVIPTTLVMRVK